MLLQDGEDRKVDRASQPGKDSGVLHGEEAEFS